MREIKILFTGASGYGNLGDDMYKIVFSEQLKKLLPEARCIFDSPYPDTRMIQSCDLVVIGGGGLIYNNGTQHFQYMSMYLESAIKNKVPIAFASCGVQFADYKHGITKPKDMKENLSVWKKYFDRAEFISVRSEFCKEAIQNVTENKNVFYAPDLGYLLSAEDYSISMKNSVLFLPTASSVNGQNYKRYYSKFVSLKDNIYFAAMSRDDYSVVENQAKSISTYENYGARKFLSPREICAMIRDAKIVVTSRYHGLIFGRAMGKIVGKDLFITDGRYKSLVEDVNSDIIEAPKLHIDLIYKFLTSRS